MKKFFEFIIGTALVITVISIISPEFGGILKKHIPVIGNDVVNMTEELAETGVAKLEIKPQNKEVVNTVIDEVCDLAHSGFNFYASEDKTQVDRGKQDLKDLFAIGVEQVYIQMEQSAQAE